MLRIHPILAYVVLHHPISDLKITLVNVPQPFVHFPQCNAKVIRLKYDCDQAEMCEREEETSWADETFCFLPRLLFPAIPPLAPSPLL